jgi:hypothetical protein
MVPAVTSGVSYKLALSGAILRAACGDQVAKCLGDTFNRLVVTPFREPQAVPVLAVGIDHTVDVLPRQPVRIRRIRHA